MDWLEVLKEFVTPVSVGLFMLYINKRDAKMRIRKTQKTRCFSRLLTVLMPV